MNSEGKDTISRLSELFKSIAGWSYDHRWVVLIAGFMAWGLGGYLASSARIDNSFAAFFDTDDPTYNAYQQFRKDFESDEIAYIVYRAKDGPWDIDVMRTIAKLTTAIEDEVPFVKDVTSLSNVEFMEGAPPDDLIVYDLLEEFPEDQDALSATAEKVMKKPLYIGGLVSADAKLGAIIVEANRSSIDPVDQIRLDPEGGDGLHNLYPQVTFDALKAILARPEFTGIEFFATGDVPINATYNTVFIEEDLPLLLFLSMIVIALSLALVFRRPIAVLAPFMVVAFAGAISLAVIGVLGWSIDFMFGLMPTLLITVGVADSVHILTEFGIYQRETGSRREAAVKTLYLVGAPCLLTSLTTAAGFLSLAFSPVKSIAHLSVYSAAGVLAAFIASITILVAFLSFGKPTILVQKESSRLNAFLDGIASFVIRFKKPIAAFSAVLFVVAGYGIFLLKVDSNFLSEFSKKVPVRIATQFTDDHMAGSSSLVYLFDTGEADGVKEPSVLKEIERVQRYAEEHDLVTKSYSIVDLIKDINQSFHNGDAAFHKIPESRELVAQYLLVYELSGGDSIRDYVSMDCARATLELRTKLTHTSLLQAMVDDVDAKLAQKPLQASTLSATGIGALWVQFVDYITWSQIQGALIALTVVSILMCLVFGSIKVGLLSMIPNITPVVLIIGGMGWSGVALDYYRLLIAPVAIGIAVDDTIHMMTRFRHEFARLGNYEQALRTSMKGVGRALLITSSILIAGFLMNLFSLMDGQKSFGLLLAFVIGIALIADFFLMPALILLLKPFGKERS